MWDLLLPIAYAILLWWVSTGLALLAVGRSRERSPAALAGAGLLLAGSLAVLAATRDDASRFGHYAAFTAAIGAWGAAEITFLTGWITGPWRRSCPPGLGRWAQAGYATSAILWHELSLFTCGAGVVIATWDGRNGTGVWCFAALLGMRVSAKLNIFLGVPNITEGFLPAHLGHLKTFFARRPMNGLFPVSVTVSTVVLVLVGQRAAVAEGADMSGHLLVAALVALGLLEHWLLVLPLPVERIWDWSLAPRPLGPAADVNAAFRPRPPLAAERLTVLANSGSAGVSP